MTKTDKDKQQFGFSKHISQLTTLSF